MERESAPESLNPEQVGRLVDRGVSAEDIIRLLVATGTWSEAGAAETLRHWRLVPSAPAAAGQRNQDGRGRGHLRKFRRGLQPD